METDKAVSDVLSHVGKERKTGGSLFFDLTPQAALPKDEKMIADKRRNFEKMSKLAEEKNEREKKMDY